jgi:hypothetical protein
MLNLLDATPGGDVSLVLPAPDGLGLPATTPQSGNVDVPVSRMPEGIYLLRASVDGADSLLQIDPLSGRYAAPTVAL